jgi:hypothetical protein
MEILILKSLGKSIRPRRPVTAEAAGSSPVTPAISFQLLTQNQIQNSSLRLSHSFDHLCSSLITFDQFGSTRGGKREESDRVIKFEPQRGVA